MTPTRTELAYDILMKLLDQDIQNFPVVNAFLIADEFLEEVKLHESENKVVFDEHK